MKYITDKQASIILGISKEEVIGRATVDGVLYKGKNGYEVTSCWLKKTLHKNFNCKCENCGGKKKWPK